MTLSSAHINPRQDLLGPSNPLKLLSTTDPAPDTDSDLLLAHMLQLEFDREHDHMLNAEEKHYNKHNRGEWSGLYYFHPILVHHMTQY